MHRFGELEAEIMDVVWNADDRVVVRDVVEALRSTRAPAYTTIQTVMDILHRKGWLARERSGRAYAYWPAVTRDEYARSLIEEALAETPDRTGVLARFVAEMDPDEAAELRKAISKAKRRKT